MNEILHKSEISWSRIKIMFHWSQDQRVFATTISRFFDIDVWSAAGSIKPLGVFEKKNTTAERHGDSAHTIFQNQGLRWSSLHAKKTWRFRIVFWERAKTTQDWPKGVKLCWVGIFPSSAPFFVVVGFVVVVQMSIVRKSELCATLRNQRRIFLQWCHCH